MAASMVSLGGTNSVRMPKPSMNDGFVFGREDGLKIGFDLEFSPRFIPALPRLDVQLIKFLPACGYGSMCSHCESIPRTHGYTEEYL